MHGSHHRSVAANTLFATLRLQNRPLREVHQLSNVARPRCLDQVGCVCGVQAWRLAPIFIGILPGEVGEERQNVFPARAQGRASITRPASLKKRSSRMFKPPLDVKRLEIAITRNRGGEPSSAEAALSASKSRACALSGQGIHIFKAQDAAFA